MVENEIHSDDIIQATITHTTERRFDYYSFEKYIYMHNGVFIPARSIFRRPLIFSSRINLCEWVLCRLISTAQWHSTLPSAEHRWIQFLKRRWWFRWRHNEAIENEHFISSIECSFNPWVICHHLKLLEPLMRCVFVPEWFFELNEHHCGVD